jgi:hypothetical protein
MDPIVEGFLTWPMDFSGSIELSVAHGPGLNNDGP